jgi:hypothetical protein
VPGKTVLVHDSFGDYVGPLLEPFTAELTATLWPRRTAAQMAAEVRDADQVVFEMVERNLSQVFTPGGVADQLVDEVRRR